MQPVSVTVCGFGVSSERGVTKPAILGCVRLAPVRGQPLAALKVKDGSTTESRAMHRGVAFIVVESPSVARQRGVPRRALLAGSPNENIPRSCYSAGCKFLRRRLLLTCSQSLRLTRTSGQAC